MFVAGAVVIFLARKNQRFADPELTNAADLIATDTQQSAPEFFVADPVLLVQNAHKIQEVVRSDDKSILPNAPYFILLQDGRFAFGYSDQNGKTRALFMAQDIPYELYLYDEAWAQWEAHRPDTGI